MNGDVVREQEEVRVVVERVLERADARLPAALPLAVDDGRGIRVDHGLGPLPVARDQPLDVVGVAAVVVVEKGDERLPRERDAAVGGRGAPEAVLGV